MAANSSDCVPMTLIFSPPWGRTRYSILSSFRGIRSRRYSLRALYHIARPEQARPGIGRPDNGLYPHIYMLYITALRHAGVAKSARPWYHRLTRTCLSLSIDGTVKKQVLWRDTLENGSSGFAAQRRAAAQQSQMIRFQGCPSIELVFSLYHRLTRTNKSLSIDGTTDARFSQPRRGGAP